MHTDLCAILHRIDNYGNILPLALGLEPVTLGLQSHALHTELSVMVLHVQLPVQCK